MKKVMVFQGSAVTFVVGLLVYSGMYIFTYKSVLNASMLNISMMCGLLVGVALLVIYFVVLQTVLLASI